MSDDKTKIMNDSQSTQRMPSREEKNDTSAHGGGGSKMVPSSKGMKSFDLSRKARVRQKFI